MAHYSAREARGSEDEPAQRKEEEAKEVKEAIKALERMEEEDEEEEEEEGGAGVQRTLLRELLALLRRRAHIMPAGAVQEVEEALVACVRAAEGLSGQATLRPLYDLYQTMLDRVTEGVFWLELVRFGTLFSEEEVHVLNRLLPSSSSSSSSGSLSSSSSSPSGAPYTRLPRSISLLTVRVAARKEEGSIRTKVTVAAHSSAQRVRTWVEDVEVNVEWGKREDGMKSRGDLFADAHVRVGVRATLQRGGAQRGAASTLVAASVYSLSSLGFQVTEHHDRSHPDAQVRVSTAVPASVGVFLSGHAAAASNLKQAEVPVRPSRQRAQTQMLAAWGRSAGDSEEGRDGVGSEKGGVQVSSDSEYGVAKTLTEVEATTSEGWQPRLGLGINRR